MQKEPYLYFHIWAKACCEGDIDRKENNVVHHDVDSTNVQIIFRRMWSSISVWAGTWHVTQWVQSVVVMVWYAFCESAVVDFWSNANAVDSNIWKVNSAAPVMDLKRQTKYWGLKKTQYYLYYVWNRAINLWVHELAFAVIQQDLLLKRDVHLFIAYNVYFYQAKLNFEVTIYQLHLYIELVR